MSNVCQSAPICCGEQHLRHLQPVFDLRPLGGYLLPAQFYAQQVVRGHEPRFDRERDLTVYLRQLPLHGFDGRKVVPERYHLPEVGVGAFAHLGCGLLQLQLRDLFAQPGEFVAADDLQPCEQGCTAVTEPRMPRFTSDRGSDPIWGIAKSACTSPCWAWNTPPEAETCGK